MPVSSRVQAEVAVALVGPAAKVWQAARAATAALTTEESRILSVG